MGVIQQLHWPVGFVEPRLKINGRLSILLEGEEVVVMFSF